MSSSSNTKEGLVPEYMRQPILNFFKMGQDPTTICAVLQLSLEGVSQVIEQYLEDPQATSDIIASIIQESQQFRCPNSAKLISEPVVIIGDTKTYDLRSLNTVDSNKVQPSLMAKEVISKFSLKSLKTLETCLQKNVQAETVIGLTAECISVLDPTSHIESIISIFIKASSDQFRLLLQSLNSLVSAESLRSILSLIKEREECQAQTIAMFRHLLLVLKDSYHYEADFSAFLAFLHKCPTCPQAGNLAFDVIETCNPSQLSQLQKVLNSDVTSDKQLISLSLRTLKSEGSVSETLIGILDLIVQTLFKDKGKLERDPTLESLSIELGRLDSELNDLKVETKRMEEEYKEAKQLIAEINKQQEDMHSYEAENPEFIYSYRERTGTLHWTKLSSGEQFSHTFPEYKFYDGCSWCTLPENLIYFTGGSDSAYKNDVVSFDRQSLTLTPRPAMLNARCYHNTAYSEGYLYAIGGCNQTGLMRECERFSVESNKWKAISPLPFAVSNHSVIVQDSSQSLYVLGGYTSSGWTDAIQELNLRKNTWRQLSFTLPSKSNTYRISSFKLKTHPKYLFFVYEGSLYSWNPNSPPRQLKNLPANIQSYWGPSYYQGTLYCSNYQGAVTKLAIGSLV